ncbi:MAG: hypothetical protein KAU91_04070 [Candidatus Aminicenantes bacterium]|nr:hypothetical protein [Candidatus Aminicenantes bacterium]
MKHTNWIFLGFVVVLAFALMMPIGCKQEAEEQEEEAEVEVAEEVEEAIVELPAAVIEAIKADFPDAQIDTVEVSEEAGITLYDIEFKDDMGEIEVAQDGTVIDITTVITMEEIPEAAAKVLLMAAEGCTIKRLEKSEVRSEIKVEEEEGTIVKLDSPRYIYEAELMKDDQMGEIEVDADGKIIEELNWDIKDKKEDNTLI